MMETAGGFGVIGAALLLGLRHGIDWDHIAAITDIAATQDERRRGVALGTLYALGHAGVVLVLGIIAIAAGQSLPPSADGMMGRVVGWTLLVLGGYVLYTLIRYRGRVPMRSRWMILIGAARSVVGAVQRRFSANSDGVHDHDHAALEDFHHPRSGEAGSPARGAGPFIAPRHRHPHRHGVEEAFAQYGTATSVGVGMLHGIGAETPTQMLVFLAAAHAGGTAIGITVLVAFVAGLVAANTAIVLAATGGFGAASRRPRARLVLGSATAAVSLAVGALLVLGNGSSLPAFFAG